MDDEPNNSNARPAAPAYAAPTSSAFSLYPSALLGAAIAVTGALVFTGLVLATSGVSPIDAFRLVLLGAFSTPGRLADAVMLAAPLTLCAVGLTITFAAGLYNLGVEGQVTLGAVFAMLVLRLLPELPPPLLWLLAFGAGALGGALWALLAGALKLYARVSEIFAGLGLNFLATGVTLYLVFGPWKRPGTASMSGTEPLPEALWLPTLDGLRLAPVAPVVALVALALVWFALSRTHWGLAVRATGLNAAAAARLGVPTGRRLLGALAACGALAGIAGTIQVLAVFHALIPNISSGVGLIGLLVALLVRANPAWVLPVAAAFACFTVGSIQLPLALGIDSSIAGVLQGALVLFALAGAALLPARGRRG
jgi:general nucleoside transport system permease protein